MCLTCGRVSRGRAEVASGHSPASQVSMERNTRLEAISVGHLAGKKACEPQRHSLQCPLCPLARLALLTHNCWVGVWQTGARLTMVDRLSQGHEPWKEFGPWNQASLVQSLCKTVHRAHSLGYKRILIKGTIFFTRRGLHFISPFMHIILTLQCSLQYYFPLSTPLMDPPPEEKILDPRIQHWTRLPSLPPATVFTSALPLQLLALWHPPPASKVSNTTALSYLWGMHLPREVQRENFRMEAASFFTSFMFDFLFLSWN